MTLARSIVVAVPEAEPTSWLDFPAGEEPESAESRRPALELDDLNLRCAQWLRKVAHGDHAAFTELYEATTARMWPLALRIVGQFQSAEDVLADLYFQVWRTAGSYDPSRCAALGWMTVLCRSRALDHLRRRDRAEPRDDMEALADSVADGFWTKDGEEIDPGGPSGVLRRQNLDRLDQALAGLPALRRQLLSMACFRGLSHSELAVHFDLPLGSVKTHMRMALAHVRRCLSTETAP